MIIRRVVPLLCVLFGGLPLFGERMTDAEIERFLTHGRVVSAVEIGNGITRPKKVILEQDGVQMKAAFKTVAIDHQNKKVRVGDKVTFGFTDNYQYERAAYLVDRLLGMRMVPVAVLREIDGEPGVLIEWISDAVDEIDRVTRKIDPPEPDRLLYQQEIMRVFDLLILNDDRNSTNQLITTADWKLHLIDHSRSFRLTKLSPGDSERQPLRIPRWLHENLRALDGKELLVQLKGLMSRVRIKAVLSRRDRLLKMIEMDLESYGENAVFIDLPQKVID
jgi:hypothetical protein